MSQLRRFFLFLFLGFIAILVQGTFLRSLFPGYLVPNLLIVLLVYLGFYESNALGAVLAFLLGLQLDLCSELLLGPWAGSFVVVFCVLTLLSQRIFVESILVVFLACGLASLFCSLLYLSLIYEFKPVGSQVWSLLLTEAVLTGAVGPLVFYPLRRGLRGKERPWRSEP